MFGLNSLLGVPNLWGASLPHCNHSLTCALCWCWRATRGTLNCVCIWSLRMVHPWQRRGSMMISAEEVLSKGKQIWSISCPHGCERLSCTVCRCWRATGGTTKSVCVRRLWSIWLWCKRGTSEGRIVKWNPTCFVLVIVNNLLSFASLVEWEVQRFCCATIRVTSVGADLPCSPMLDLGTMALVLWCDAQHVGCSEISTCHKASRAH